MPPWLPLPCLSEDGGKGEGPLGGKSSIKLDQLRRKGQSLHHLNGGAGEGLKALKLELRMQVCPLADSGSAASSTRSGGRAAWVEEAGETKPQA